MIADNESVISSRSQASEKSLRITHSVRRKMRAFGDVRTTYGRKRKETHVPHGAVSKTLSWNEEPVLLQVYYTDPKSLLHHYHVASYLKNNWDDDGIQIVTLCMVPNIHAKRSFRKTDKVPLDKCTLDNACVGTSIPNSE